MRIGQRDWADRLGCLLSAFLSLLTELGCVGFGHGEADNAQKGPLQKSKGTITVAGKGRRYWPT
jgi:hypothetical protein